ncbi:alpha/beta hydrolase [Mycobacterium avium subsp. paratuberculosis 10-4404]|nr:alpha/beta hydrolase [Mycobacterium avium subsp. paratuberculosis 10-4404]
MPDVLPGYWQRTLALGADPAGEGDIVATLIRRGDDAAPAADHAVLAVHGYTDYFFHTALADHFAARGFAFYALDLHKCGRSRRDGQTPHFVTDLANYDTELERALSVASGGNRRVLVYGHSAGGLIVSLWLDRLRRRNPVAHSAVGGLVLNSPFLELPGPPILRHSLTVALIAGLSRVRSKGVARSPVQGGYGTTLHRDYGGEFDYNLQWKPVGGFPITFGWLHAVRRGQARLHRGLDVGVPNLILRSDHSVQETPDPASMHRGDAVLDVTQIARWAGCIGNRSTIIPVADAKHDVFLSLPGPRAAAYRQLDLWLDGYLRDRSTDSTRARRPGTKVRRRTWKPTTSRSSEPVRATAFSMPASPASGPPSASTAPSAEPASTSGASPPRCSSTPPTSPRRSGRRPATASTRTSTGCAGPTSSPASSAASTRSRSAAKSIGAPRSISTCTAATPGSGRCNSTAVTCCAPTPANSSPPSRW